MNEPEASGSNEKANPLAFLENFKGLKTFKAKTGTIYAVLATAGGLTLSVTPKVEITPKFIGLVLRVRAQKAEDWANLEEAKNIFGFDFTARSATHASVDILMWVCPIAVSKYTFGRVVEENGVIRMLCSAVRDRAQASLEAYSKGKGKEFGVEASEEVLVEYVRNIISDHMPSAEPKMLDKSDFVVSFNNSDAMARLEALSKKYGPKPVAEADPK